MDQSVSLLMDIMNSYLKNPKTQNISLRCVNSSMKSNGALMVIDAYSGMKIESLMKCIATIMSQKFKI